jgi:hypothetical protein
LTRAELTTSACTIDSGSCSQSIYTQCVASVNQLPVSAIVNIFYSDITCAAAPTGYEIFVIGACQPGPSQYTCNSTYLIAAQYGSPLCQGLITNNVSIPLKMCAAQIIGATTQMCVTRSAPMTTLGTTKAPTGAPTMTSVSPTPANHAVYVAGNWRLSLFLCGVFLAIGY